MRDVGSCHIAVAVSVWVVRVASPAEATWALGMGLAVVGAALVLFLVETVLVRSVGYAVELLGPAESSPVGP